MIRSMLCAGLFLVAESWVLAAEPTTSATAPTLIHPASDMKPATAGAGRKKLEAQLQSPAGLDFGNRQTVAISEVLDQLHEKHGLSIRFDMPTLRASLGWVGLAAPENPNAVPGPRTDSPAPAEELKSNVPLSKESSSSNTSTAPKLTSREEPVDSPDVVQGALELRLKSTKIKIHDVDLKNVSIATALRHAFDALPGSELDEEFVGLPIAVTNAALWDFVVEEDGLLITTRMNALTLKETRVYPIKQFKDFSPEQLATVVRRSVRPWSWRSQIDDLGDQLKAGAPQLPQEMVASLVKTGVHLASSTTGIAVDASTGADSKSTEEKSAATKDALASEAAQMAMVGNAVVNGLVSVAHASVSAMEIVHFADPPTATIQTLPGKLIITQSQAAHREIADLLKQLTEE